MARVELETVVRFAQKLSEPKQVFDRFRQETVPHFFTRVPDRGVVSIFHDAGSRAVRIRTSRYSGAENNQHLSPDKST